MIDLDDVAGLCPGLHAASAEPLAFRAVIALQRRHRPGVTLQVTLGGKELREALSWSERPTELAQMEDFNRVTEEGAEALALALAGRQCGWSVRRRLQSRSSEGADWLMASGTAKVIVEVGGTDDGDLDVLQKRKSGKRERRRGRSKSSELRVWYASSSRRYCSGGAMTLDELNARVTAAILRAERLPEGSDQAQAAFREVGRIEESIAALMPADDLEGEIARLGAVTAALSAGEPLRALWLVDRYLAEGVSPEAATKLDALRAEADVKLAEMAAKVPLVRPIKYALQDAA